MSKVLTVSIAAYNVSRFLAKALDSLIVEDEFATKLEVIIVNDGSADETLSIAKEYEKKHPETFKVIDKKNGGYGSTINEAVKIAKGKYFKLLDGDDWYINDELCGFLRFLEKSEADMVVSPYYRVYESKMEHILESRHCELTDEEMLITEDRPSESIRMFEIAIKTAILRENKIKISENCFYTDNEYNFFALINSKTIVRFERPIYCHGLGIEGQSVSLLGIRKYYKDITVVANKMYGWYSDYIRKNGKTHLSKLLKSEIVRITRQTYHTYMVLEKPMSRLSELKEFDESVKKIFPQIYMETMVIRVVRTLRKLHFHFYGIACKIALKRYLANERKVF